MSASAAARRPVHERRTRAGAVLSRILVLAIVVAAVLPASAEGHARETARRSVSLAGTLEIGHFDPRGAGPARRFAVLATRTGTIPLRFIEQAPVGLAGSRVSLRGVRSGDTVTVQGLRVTNRPAGMRLQTLSAATATDLPVAVLLFNFANDTSQPWTVDATRGAVFTNADSASAYYQEVTYGKLRLVGNVFGWFTLPSSNTTCDFTTWATQAKAAATASGVDLSSYQRFVLAFPFVPSCGWAGVGTGVDAWLNGTIALRFSTHELGHTFGLGHSKSMSCTEGGQRVAISSDISTCTVDEYGDPFDVMGSAANHHLSNYDRASAGWLDPSGLQTVTASGTYMLAPAESFDATAPRLLKVRRSDGSWLDLEYRQRFGQYFDNFPPDDPVVNGVTVRWTTSAGGPSRLIDTTPETSVYYDSALAVGRTLTDSGGGVTITTVSTLATGVTLEITITAATTDTDPPTVPASVTATAADATTVSLSWGAATDNVGVTGYRIYRDGLPVATTDGAARSWSDDGRTPGTTYLYSVSALDAANNAGPSLTAAVTTPAAADVTPPTAPSGVTATVGKAKKVILAWTPATDNTGVVAYRVFRNGTQVASVGTTTFTDSIPARTRTLTYVVTALDAAGNQSPPSAAVSVSV